ncbi:MAG: tRNA pseudouridine(55) synthase TruB [Thermodesulfobacteriota bacterium]
MSVVQQGLLLVDKPTGITSFGLVERVRRWFGIRGVGHTGSLDPFATGLMVLCLGRATRLARFITEWDKEYYGAIKLGQETDTDDPTGTVTFSREPRGLEKGQVEDALGKFRGVIHQVPPVFSAKKKEGVPSYRRARRGEQVHLPAVAVKIYSLDLVSFEPPMVRFTARCSKGTYMRSLARDLGRALGCGAHLKELRRMAIGPLKVEEAVSLEVLKGRRGVGLDGLSWPVERVLSHWDAVSLSRAQRWKVCNGQDIPLHELHGLEAFKVREGDYVRLLGESGEFLAVGRVVRGTAGLCLHPEQVWAAQGTSEP